MISKSTSCEFESHEKRLDAEKMYVPPDRVQLEEYWEVGSTKKRVLKSIYAAFTKPQS